MANCCCCPDRPVVTDEVCGNFSFTGAGPITVFDTPGTILPFGSVSVFYESGTDPSITVTVPGFPPVTVPLGNTRTITVESIDNVQISGTAGPHTGKYCLNLHYRALF
ncbi:MAG: S-Ena type endospore appendage [Thermoactinomyces sp.]